MLRAVVLARPVERHFCSQCRPRCGAVVWSVVGGMRRGSGAEVAKLTGVPDRRGRGRAGDTLRRAGRGLGLLLLGDEALKVRSAGGEGSQGGWQRQWKRGEDGSARGSTNWRDVAKSKSAQGRNATLENLRWSVAVGLLQLLSCCLVLARTGRRMTGSRGARGPPSQGQGQGQGRTGTGQPPAGRKSQCLEPGDGLMKGGGGGEGNFGPQC